VEVVKCLVGRPQKALELVLLTRKKKRNSHPN
jgi:hypothetical protein